MRLVTPFALILLATAALADEPRAPDMPAPAQAPHVSFYGRTNAACLEWTDSCQICMRIPEDGKLGPTHCSTPGIACTPSAITCLRP